MVEHLLKQPGWEILSRDLGILKNQKSEEIPYLPKNSEEFDNAVLDYRSIDRFFKLIEDYQINREKAVETLQKMDNPKENIVLDIDNA